MKQSIGDIVDFVWNNKDKSKSFVKAMVEDMFMDSSMVNTSKGSDELSLLKLKNKKNLENFSILEKKYLKLLKGRDHLNSGVRRLSDDNEKTIQIKYAEVKDQLLPDVVYVLQSKISKEYSELCAEIAVMFLTKKFNKLYEKQLANDDKEDLVRILKITFLIKYPQVKYESFKDEDDNILKEFITAVIDLHVQLRKHKMYLFGGNKSEYTPSIQDLFAQKLTVSKSIIPGLKNSRDIFAKEEVIIEVKEKY